METLGETSQAKEPTGLGGRIEEREERGRREEKRERHPERKWEGGSGDRGGMGRTQGPEQKGRRDPETDPE